MILFNVPLVTGKEFFYIAKLLIKMKFCGDAEFTQMCNSWLENYTNTKAALLTTSCTHALEMAALLTDVKQGDEIIIPSYTFVSTANAFVIRGAKIKFVDIRPDTMNINEKLIEDAITDKTKVIVPVHNAGISCEMDTILEIAKNNELIVIEDAAQAMMCTYKDKALGTIGEMGCYSYHETKNYQCGEGGAILLNKDKYKEKAEIIREKGTNRAKFHRGEADKYSWMDIGSSYLPSELSAAFLYAQLEMAEEINNKRLKLWSKYYSNLHEIANKEQIELPYVPEYCEHNGHMFFIKTKDIRERTKLINFLKSKDIQATFHYVPLHTSKAGKQHGEFIGEDKYTTKESERLLRLPMYYELTLDQVDYICECIEKFYND